MVLCGQHEIRKCGNCALRLPSTLISQTLNPFPLAKPFARWGMDFTGPLSVNKERYFLLNAVDYATGWYYSSSCAVGTAHDVIQMINCIMLLHGPTLKIVSDNGSQFVASQVIDFLRFYQIRHCRTTPYHPRTNGRVERFNGVLKKIFSAIHHDHPVLSFLQVLDIALRT